MRRSATRWRRSRRGRRRRTRSRKMKKMINESFSSWACTDRELECAVLLRRR